MRTTYHQYIQEGKPLESGMVAGHIKAHLVEVGARARVLGAPGSDGQIIGGLDDGRRLGVQIEGAALAVSGPQLLCSTPHRAVFAVPDGCGRLAGAQQDATLRAIVHEDLRGGVANEDLTVFKSPDSRRQCECLCFLCLGNNKAKLWMANCSHWCKQKHNGVILTSNSVHFLRAMISTTADLACAACAVNVAAN